MSGTKTKSKSLLPNPFERERVHSAGKKVAKVASDEMRLNWMEVLKQTFGMEFADKKTADGAESHVQQEATEAVHHGPKQIEVFNFFTHQDAAPQSHTEKAPKARAEAAIRYHEQFQDKVIKSREQASRSEMHQMHQNVEQIKVELSKLIASSQVLKMEFAEVGVDQTTQNIGTYHLNLFEWMLAVIRAARQKVEDSNAWLGTVKGKGAKKGYWGMFKKHGTTFGLSGERAVATQVG